MSSAVPNPTGKLEYRFEGKLKTIHLDRPTILIGRSPDCDLSLASPLVSRRHARLVFEAGSWWIEDQQSTGGTYVNGQRVERQQLREGDVIRVGEFDLHFSMMESAPAPSQSDDFAMPDSAPTSAKPLPPQLQERLPVPNQERPRGTAADAGPVDFAELKKVLHAKLIDRLDLTAINKIDPDKLRTELRTAADRVIEIENPLLSRTDRTTIVQAVMDKMFADREPVENSGPAANVTQPATTSRGKPVTENPKVRDTVDCTIFAPPVVKRDEQFLVQVFVHMPEEAEAAACEAKEFDADAQRRGATSLGTEIARGSMLTFELSMRDANIDEPVRDLVWRGRRSSVQFGVEIPAQVTRENLLGTVTVSQDSVPIGTVTFKLKLVLGHTPAAATPAPTGEARRYSQAFISYASHDRSEVIRRVQMLKNVGISFFQDVLNLEPGERWAQRLYERIDHSDVLFLFWSTAAKKSEWVAKEWQYALEKKGDDFIRPVGIEGPPIPEPPAELAHLHFGDPLLYFIQPKS